MLSDLCSGEQILQFPHLLLGHLKDRISGWMLVLRSAVIEMYVEQVFGDILIIVLTTKLQIYKDCLGPFEVGF